MTAAFEEQRISQTLAFQESLSQTLSVQAHADSSLDVEEAVEKVRQAEAEWVVLAARCAERKKALSSNIMTATADTNRQSRLRSSRIADLEEETEHLQRKWGQAISNFGAHKAASLSSLPGTETTSQPTED